MNFPLDTAALAVTTHPVQNIIISRVKAPRTTPHKKGV